VFAVNNVVVGTVLLLLFEPVPPVLPPVKPPGLLIKN
jgi:hypothetical protein